MATKTAAQMTADGYSVIRGDGERFQIWTGSTPEGEAAERVWDAGTDFLGTVPGIYKQYTERTPQDTILMDFGCAIVIKEMVQSAAFNGISAGVKNAWLQALNLAFDPD
jgi:hypothetical protein